MTMPVIMTQSSPLNSENDCLIHLPFIALNALSFNKALLSETYDWIIFSSKNAVKYFKEYFAGMDIKHVAAIGEKTCDYCRELGIHVDFYPKNYSQEGFIEEFIVKKNEKIILPSSQKARPLLVNALEKAEAKVVKIDLYETVAYTKNIEFAISLLQKGLASGVAFASSSAVEYFFDVVNKNQFEKDIDFYAIGTPTFEKIQQYGFSAKIAKTQTINGLINIIKESRNH